MSNTHIFDNLICPKCHSSLNFEDDKLRCPSCSRDYPFVDGIPDFRDKEGYWCNVGREKMQELNRLAKEERDWLGAAKKIVPQYTDHFIPFDRADCQFLWPSTKDSKILDAGSMWGGIAIPAAQFHREIYAVDKTKETLEFLKIRAQQMGFENIYTVASELQDLPFPDGFFDLVVLSGVLEWVAFDEEIVLKKHWRKFGRGLKAERRARYTEGPKATQLRVLRELGRVLKPSGSLYLAVENRVGYIYLAGFPDGHMNMPFICFMPRLIANTITKLTLNCEYRTYVYGIPGYKSLLKQSGFRGIDFYGAFMHYIAPTEIVPLGLIKNLRRKILSTKGNFNRILLSLFPKSLLKWLPPSIIAIATKDSLQPDVEPRLIQLLRKAGLLKNDFYDNKIIKCDSRAGNNLTANYWIYDGNKDKPRYFCKICRNKQFIDILDRESKNLKVADQLFRNTNLAYCIPKLLYYGNIDDITFLVTEFVEGKSSKFDFNNRLKTKLKYLDIENKIAIRFLAGFQKQTAIKQVEAAGYLTAFLEDKQKILEVVNLFTEDVEVSMESARQEVEQLKGLYMPLCSQHGDFDFCNMLFTKDGIWIADFEHFQQEAMPFLDLATLVFNPILVSHEYKKEGLPFRVLLERYNLRRHINEWFNLYAELSGMPSELIRLVPFLAALEQKTKKYPYYRNPDTFPINIAFNEMLKLRITEEFISCQK